jgi:hypothetical protein
MFRSLGESLTETRRPARRERSGSNEQCRKEADCIANAVLDQHDIDLRRNDSELFDLRDDR